ncbi:LEPR-XLL domain-containing protein, partial [Thermodesulfobacteriota bacterium]
MKRSQIPNPFELENLEPRIMLSGDPLVGMVDSIAPDELDSLDTGLEIPPLEENLNSGEDDSQNPAYKQSLQYNPSQNLAGIFSGLTEEDPLADKNGDATTDNIDTVPLSNHSITEGEKSAILQGMDELTNLGHLLEDFDAFGVPLPLIKDTTLGKLFRPYKVLDNRLSTPVYDYFSDATDPPTTNGLLATLQNIPSTTDLVVTVDAVSGGYDAVSDEIRFDMDFQTTREGEVYLHAGPLAEELGFEFEEGTQSEYIAGITFDFTFGVDLKGGINEFFLEVHELVADLDISISALNCNVGLETAQGFTEVVNGVVDLNAEVSVQFDETIAGDGRITLTELRSIKSETIDDFVHLAPTGTLFAELPLEGTQGDSGNSTTHIYARSENLFASPTPDISVRTDISPLKDPILDLLKEFKDIGENITSFESLNVNLPVIDSSVNNLLSDQADSGFGTFLNLYTPALDYFTLLEAFNFDISEYLPLIGALPGIDIPDFDINRDDHRLKLKNLIEKEYDLHLDQNWDLSLYLPEIWSLFNSDFQIDEYLPKFQILLGLPYVPKMDEVRSNIKSFFRSFPSLDGLMNYIRTTSLTDLFHDFQGGLSQNPFSLNGVYDPASTEVRINFLADAVKEMNFTVDPVSLFPDQFQDLGISFDSDLAFTLTLGLKFDISASLSGKNYFLTMGEASVTVQVNEEINGLSVTQEDLPNQNLGVSGGRFDFDSRVEFVFHGLDPPFTQTLNLPDFLSTTNSDSLMETQASGTFSLELPITDSDQTYIIVCTSSDNVFDAISLNLTVDVQQDLTLPDDTSLVVGPSDTLKGSGTIDGDVILGGGVFSPGNSPGIVNITGNLTIDGDDLDTIDDDYDPPSPSGDDIVGTIVIEIAGTGVAGVGYDQINVSGSVSLGGTLTVSLLGGFVPTLGQKFDFLTFGSVSDAFADATGLFGFGDGSLYFEIVQLSDRLQLQVRQSPGGNELQFKETSDDDALGKIFSNHFPTYSADVSVSFE